MTQLVELRDAKIRFDEAGIALYAAYVGFLNSRYCHLAFEIIGR